MLFPSNGTILSTAQHLVKTYPLILHIVYHAMLCISTSFWSEWTSADFVDGGQVRQGHTGQRMGASGVSFLNILKGQAGRTTAALLLKEDLLCKMQHKKKEDKADHEN